jgi:alpha-glucoside transport system permease protein
MKVTKRGATLFINGSLLVIVVLWTIPLVGLLISSVRNSDAIRSSGWWTVFPHQEQVTSEERPIPKGQASDQPITIDGVTKSFKEWKAGVTMPDGSLLTWVGTVRVGKLVVSKQQLTADTNIWLIPSSIH